MSRTGNRVFLPQAALDEWMVEGLVELHDGELTILTVGRRFKLSEAIRVLDEVSGGGDIHNLTGRARERSVLESTGAEIFETSMLLGDAAYDVQPGWVATPIGSFAEHLASDARKRAGPGRTEPKDDEDLLGLFLAGNL